VALLPLLVAAGAVLYALAVAIALPDFAARSFSKLVSRLPRERA
jgi:hypothetical protein